MLVLGDNDGGGAVAVLRRILESAENVVWLDLVNITFTDFEALGLPRDAPDRLVWQTCRAPGDVRATRREQGALPATQAAASHSSRAHRRLPGRRVKGRQSRSSETRSAWPTHHDGG